MPKAGVPEWFARRYGPEKLEEVKFPPTLRLREEEPVEVLVTEPEPRIVETRYGQRVVIVVEKDGEDRSLWLTNLDLARKIAKIQMKHGSLLGMKLKITKHRRTGKIIPFDVEVLEK